MGTTQKTTVGETLYGVIVDATSGAIVARSADFVVTTADANALHTFTLTTLFVALSGDFLAGMIQLTEASGASFFPMGIQTESPVRPGTFYRISATAPVPAPADIAGGAGALGKYKTCSASAYTRAQLRTTSATA